MARNDKNPLSEFFPPAMLGLLQKRPLVKGESAADFDALLTEIAAAIKPQDAIESIYVKDFALLTWEIDRVRGYAATILDNDIPDALAALLWRHADFSELPEKEQLQKARKLAQAYYSGDADARQVVAKCLAEIGLDETSAPAHAFMRKLTQHEAAMRLVTAAEIRRSNMLREIEQCRRSLGQRMREVVDADFVDAPALAEPEAADATKTLGHSA